MPEWFAVPFISSPPDYSAVCQYPSLFTSCSRSWFCLEEEGSVNQSGKCRLLPEVSRKADLTHDCWTVFSLSLLLEPH